MLWMFGKKDKHSEATSSCGVKGYTKKWIVTYFRKPNGRKQSCDQNKRSNHWWNQWSYSFSSHSPCLQSGDNKLNTCTFPDCGETICFIHKIIHEKLHTPGTNFNNKLKCWSPKTEMMTQSNLQCEGSCNFSSLPNQTFNAKDAAILD